HGSPTQYTEHCKYFASRGIVAATADYRVISRNNTTAIECVKDAKTCMRWIRVNADSLGVDANKIIMGGGSAGGFLCLAAAINDPEFEESTDSKNISCVPDAMVLINPVVNSEEFEFRVKKFPGKAADVNPLTHVKNNLPPAIAFHGTADEMSAFKFVEKFVDDYKKNGNEIELHSYDGMEHGFAQMNKNDGKYYKETLRLTDEWLTKKGYLTGNPTIN
ncbi:MAG: prolyl oligopeptidase family serine peptidase, partial [Fimbriimonadaceae bacterium]|nr:prolyl oligopeptidase family serine peptidase [Chitinophagales bacterium]